MSAPPPQPRAPEAADGAGGSAPAAADAAPSWGSARSVDVFEKLEQIGEGTYGQVYMAKNRETGEIVALKKVRMDNEKEGFPITAIREIKILKSLTHINVVKMKEIVVSRAHAANQNKGSIYMVFEYMDHDLTGLAERPGVKFTPAQIKCYMKQLLQGLFYCHKNNILHRDIKGSNILIDNQGVVKIADFGLARSYAGQDSTNPLTNRVITLWYRPPELLLGTTKYGPEVDMWSVGCIFAELVTGKPILPGKNEMEQVDLIFRLCGTPSEEVWPGCSKLPWYHMFKPEKPHRRRLLEHLARAPADVQDLCDKLLTLDPAKRLRADAAILHDYFFNDPQPAAPGTLPPYESSHEFQTKKRRQEARAKQEAEAAAKRAHTEAAVLAAGGVPAGGMRGHAAGAYHGGAAHSSMHPYPAPRGGGLPAAPVPGASHGMPGAYGGVYGSVPPPSAGMGMGLGGGAYGAAPRGLPPAPAGAPRPGAGAPLGQAPRGPPSVPGARPPPPPPQGGSRPH